MNFTITAESNISPQTPVAAVNGMTADGKPVVFLAVRKDANLLHEGTVNDVPVHLLVFLEDTAPWELGHQLAAAFEKAKKRISESQQNE